MACLKGEWFSINADSLNFELRILSILPYALCNRRLETRLSPVLSHGATELQGRCQSVEIMPRKRLVASDSEAFAAG